MGKAPVFCRNKKSILINFVKNLRIVITFLKCYLLLIRDKDPRNQFAAAHERYIPSRQNAAAKDCLGFETK